MTKKVIITQSNYIPWKGYFDSLNMVDSFILYDDMQYTKRDWRNRNKIKTPQGLVWLSVPVEVKGKYFQKIRDTKVSEKDWNMQHWNMLKQNYGKAAHFNDVKDFVEELYRLATFDYLSEINYHFLKNIGDFLGIKTPIGWSSDYILAEGKTEKLVEICKQTGGTDYYTGPAAKDYMDENLFTKENINVHYLDYGGYPEYNQLNPPFEHGVSILDLIFNEGKNAPQFLKTLATATNG